MENIWEFVLYQTLDILCEFFIVKYVYMYSIQYNGNGVAFNDSLPFMPSCEAWAGFNMQNVSEWQ